ncbi:FecCD family ABC transporter permease [Pseudoduganella umbonata]|uniref:Iron ABC transporter permease n=1 Tax=Pseudoduganella umbonata TaxID=864828 RepID=A0A4P8HWG0_9BURK|nr:iron ABC transporter permease [Pseudoduganella umbonata]MBB3225380.1 iron complex transport system permease protein [Pseudoduganella umbonata]QCP13228.1 iron ABC transporter permease [Pseudoduganella umbonata]
MHPISAHLRYRTGIVTAGLLLASIASLLFAGVTGSVAIPLADLPGALQELVNGRAETLAATLLDLRASRALTAFVTGATLALAGVMMQTLLRNPLADPYVLGISAGSAVGALLALMLMCAAWMVDAAAFIGAVAISMLLYLLARRDMRGGSAAEGGTALLLLTGTILSAGCAALIMLMLSIAPEGRLRSMVFWMIGDLSGAPVRWLPWLVLAAGLAFALRTARSMNVLALHAEAASTLGIRVGPLRKGLFFCSGLLTASAVTTAGSIGFVGLIVPHACRFAFGPDHRVLIPAATLAGGAYLVLADTLARTVIAPQQLPVGVVTALIGTPVFLYQLHRLRK